MTTSQVDVYDFDHTLYNGDASLNFILFCLVRHPRLWKYFPKQVSTLVLYILGSGTRKHVKEELFAFLKVMPEIEHTLTAFWDKNEHRIAEWYSFKKHESDIIISASPEFLLRPIADRLGVKSIIGTKMDPKTGLIDGKNCRAEEKVARLQQWHESITINHFYSDNLSDMPLFKLAKHPMVVKKKSVVALADYKQPKLQILSDLTFLRFLIVGGINASLGIIFSFAIDLTIKSPLLAFVLGYAISLVISYFLNAVITFRDRAFSFKKFQRFCISYIPNFVILFTLVHILVDVLHLYSLIAYIIAVAIAAPITFLLLSKFTFVDKALHEKI